MTESAPQSTPRILLVTGGSRGIGAATARLAARAGYNPRAGVTLWQKMGAASSGGPPQWLSTHPSGRTRIAEIEKNLPRVLPLYERAKP